MKPEARNPKFAWALAWLLAALLAGVSVFAEDAAPSGFGVLVLSHGGSAEWNAVVEETVRPLRERYAVEIAYGMADAATIEAGVRKLEAGGAHDIAVVRLFVSGESFLERTKQILGLAPGAPPRPEQVEAMHEHPHEHPMPQGDKLLGPQELQAHLAAVPFYRVESQARFVVSEDGLAQSPWMGEVLAERARGLSQDPARESVLILAHGPGDDAENARWVKALEALADQVRAQAKYRSVAVETLREDWPDKRASAIERIRAYVAAAGRDGGRALVIPFRVTGFGPYADVLQGLKYASDGRGLAPHANVTRWLADQVARCAERLGRARSD